MKNKIAMALFGVMSKTPIQNIYGTKRLFNIIPGTLNATFFANPCPTSSAHIRKIG
jgi:hypothetical protein